MLFLLTLHVSSLRKPALSSHSSGCLLAALVQKYKIKTAFHMKINNNLILSLSVLVLIVLSFFSIYSPIRFDREQHRREQIVRRHMLALGKAEQAYLHRHGVYTGNLQTLVDEGLLPDSLQYIPFSNGRKFKLQATVEVTQSGRQVPRLQCYAAYEDYLQGMDANRIAFRVEEAANQGAFPGLELNR